MIRARTSGLVLLGILCSLAASCATASQSPDGGATDQRQTDGQPALQDRGAEGAPDLDGGKLDSALADLASSEGAPPDTSPPDTSPPDKQPPDVQPTPDVKSPDLKPGKICDNGKDDDGDGKVDCIDLVDCGDKKPCTDPGGTLVIYEVSTGSPNYVVLRNVSKAWRSLGGGWKLEMSGGSTVKFTLPVFSLGPGKTVAIVEYSSVKAGEIPTHANIPFNSGTSSSHNNSVLLRSPGGTAVDYVAFGSVLLNLPPAVNLVGGAVKYKSYNPNAHAYYRAGMKGKYPTFVGADWYKYNKSR